MHLFISLTKESLQPLAL